MIKYDFKNKLGDQATLRKEFNPELMRTLRNLPQIRDWCRESDLISELSQHEFLKKISIDKNNLMYSIHIDGESDLIGVCGLTNILWTHRSAEWSLYIDPKWQGKGFAESALKTMIAHGFHNMNLHRIWGEIFDTNIPCLKMAEKIGFVTEGKLRQSYYKKGQYIDSLIVGMLKSEFYEHLAKSEAWRRYGDGD